MLDVEISVPIDQEMPCSCRFTPPENIDMRLPRNPWNPFACEEDALLFAMYHSHRHPISDTPMKTFLKVVKELAKIPTRLKVPSLGKLKKYRKIIPKPQVVRRKTEDGAPFLSD
ncbi:hypothetical protein K470DRAFT_176958 [Piedraia hortae CBS 480.64]|uniref:Uncharacterized protein n=1 Tax=Piedraia hortae CBS 480.64 TaxID=1314780 RepID=A0A6A7BR86_9PEZI|nr:hypothetical protein K470DRAFT_176958 [Piedraia hortae CBS 480.64]